MNNETYVRVLREILDLSRMPVAVRFMNKGEKPPEAYRSDLSLTFCQFVMMAQRGEKLIASADNLSCANGAAALGLRPLPEKIRSGEMHSRLGVFSSNNAAADASASTPRMPQESIELILVAPLSNVDFEPHVVVVQGMPAQLMWLIKAGNYDSGKRYNFSTAVSQGVCVDVTVLPYLDGEMNLSLGCFGSRNATDEEENEALLGIPFNQMDAIVEALPGLIEPAMQRAKEKTAYKRLLEKLAKA